VSPSPAISEFRETIMRAFLMLCSGGPRALTGLVVDPKRQVQGVSQT
jgi:hypothetical protein